MSSSDKCSGQKYIRVSGREHTESVVDLQVLTKENTDQMVVFCRVTQENGNNGLLQGRQTLDDNVSDISLFTLQTSIITSILRHMYLFCNLKNKEQLEEL